MRSRNGLTCNVSGLRVLRSDLALSGLESPADDPNPRNDAISLVHFQSLEKLSPRILSRSFSGLIWDRRDIPSLRSVVILRGTFSYYTEGM